MRSIISIVFILGCICLCHPLNRYNFFDIDLLRYATEDHRGNIMVSPASVKSTLAMILEGANGNTAKEIREALRLSPRKEEYRNELNKYLSALQSNTTGALLQNSNGVFVSKNIKLKPAYEAVAFKREYSAVFQYLDFRKPVFAAKVINEWVSNETKGLISTIVEPAQIVPTSDIIISNALYFKSKWHNAFSSMDTHTACFYRDDVCHNVAMMSLQASLNYAFVDDLRSHALELPYEGKRYSMVILVPQDRDGCEALLRDLPFFSLSEITKLMEPSDVRLLMPKFTVDYTEDLVIALRQMRIKSLFSSKVDLSGLFDGNSTRIDSIVHKVYMSVDEKGTEAAAATAAMVIPLIQSGVHLRVDRPFVFFIKDNEMELVLFEGKVEEPNQYEDNKNNKGLSPKPVIGNV